MTSLSTLLGVIALIAVTFACTRPEVTATTEPLAPPDSFAPSTTVTTQARTTTTVDVERASSYRVDPLTLEPLEGFEPIPMGDWFWGTTSENGSWIALSVGHDNRDLVELRLIDIDNWEVATTWTPSIDTPLHVTDDGTIYLINDPSPSFHLSRLVPGEIRPEVIADLPSSLYWYQLHIHDGLALIFGLDTPNRDDRGEAVVVTVDLSTGLVTEIPLPGVEVGIIAELDLGEMEPARLFADPAVVWDDDRSRVLIVHANQDVVTEVNPTTFEVTEHRFGNEGSIPTADGPFSIGRRIAVLGRDGRSLYVATAVQTFEAIDEGWTETLISTGIKAIDTETWEVVDRLDAPISEVYLSSAGDRLLATGQSYNYGPSTDESGSSGLYVIDPLGLELIAHHGPDQPNRFYGAFSFSKDSQIGYVTSWGQQTAIDVVDLETGDIIHTRSDPEIQIFGEVGILGEVRQFP
ncbi:MAG TPA: hypothetical protein VJA46_08000 [Acidimicrobiia bacterium]|nr:hypothetical protein [Acidimicrobiia bacterium]